jgi:hypothetical protein
VSLPPDDVAPDGDAVLVDVMAAGLTDCVGVGLVVELAELDLAELVDLGEFVELAELVDLAELVELAELVDLAELVAVDAPVRAGDALQVGLGVGWRTFSSVVVGLALVLGVEVTVPEVVGLGLLLSLGLADALELVLGLGEALALPLAVLLGLPAGDVAGVLGVPVDPVVLLGELDVDEAGDECTEGDAHADFDALGAAAGIGVGDSPATEGAEVLGWAPPGPELAGEEPDMAALRVEPNWATACRAGGTAARTRPAAKTAAPIAKAGRSIASRQSTGRRGVFRSSPRRSSPRRSSPRRSSPRRPCSSRRCESPGPAVPPRGSSACFVPWTGEWGRNKPARKPAIASQTPMAP